MLRGKSLACCPWPAVMDLPSEVHVHSYKGSCTEIAAGSSPFIATGAATPCTNVTGRKISRPVTLGKIISYAEGPLHVVTFLSRFGKTL